MKNRYIQVGFSLIEMAIVLFIVALLMGGLLPTVSNQMEQQHRSETRKQLDDIQQALIGFTILNGRLPCPASLTSSGVESTVTVGGGDCTDFFNGYVPAVTLGMTPVNDKGLLLDGWNNPIRYAVTNKNIGLATNAFTSPNGMKTATLNSLATAKPLLVVCSSSTAITANTCGTAAKLTDNAPALVYSLGKNGGATSTDADELANTNGTNINVDVVFVSHDQTPTFDDMVVWMSPNILINRMVSAGKLP
jgi:prepilin-type N-terminal cleavage/methylation domain-containing protein